MSEPVLPWPEPNEDGTVTFTEPGVYGVHGIAIVRVDEDGRPTQMGAPVAVPTAYTPPKFGPPPGCPAEKWRGLNRAERRAYLRGLAHTINQVTK